MRSLLIILSVVGVALARPGFLGLGLGARSLLHAPLAYSSVAAPVAYSNVAAAPVAYSTVAAAPVAYSNVAAAPVAYSTVAAAPVAHHIAAPLSVSSQYHAQDELGQYSYGYAGGPSAKSEVKTFDGVTRGGYSYVDARGEVQSVNYVADPVNGFRVAATNLPVAPEAIPSEPLVAPVPVEDTPEVAAAKVAHSAAFAEAKAAADAAPDVSVADEPAAEVQAVVPVARADLLPASVLSRNVEGVVPHTYAQALAYGAVAPASFSYSAIAPGVAPAPISYHAAVAPVSRFAYSSVAPSLSYAHHPISYGAAIAPASYSYSAVAPATYSYSAVAPATYSYSAVAPASYSYSAVAPAISHAPISYAVPHTITSQYHAQDELGQYSYGYSGGPSAKSEVRTLDGVTRGGYSYIDAEGKVQSVNYVADDVNGFRVAATNLPVAPVAPAAPLLETIPDTVEVSSLKAEHLVAVEEAKARLHSA